MPPVAPAGKGRTWHVLRADMAATSGSKAADGPKCSCDCWSACFVQRRYRRVVLPAARRILALREVFEDCAGGSMENKIPLVPVSWGELFDKISILEIKMERLTAEAARKNVVTELGLLRPVASPAASQVAEFFDALKSVNAELWEIEDQIRDLERAQAFDAAFVALARSVYRKNDERACIKREINLALGSGLIEEKSYSGY